MPGGPNPRLNHLISFTFQWLKIAGNSMGPRPLRQASSHRDAMCGQPSAGRASAKPVPHASRVLEFEELGSDAPEKVDYQPRQITGAAAEWFATPGNGCLSRRIAWAFDQPAAPNAAVAAVSSQKTWSSRPRPVARGGRRRPSGPGTPPSQSRRPGRPCPGAARASCDLRRPPGRPAVLPAANIRRAEAGSMGRPRRLPLRRPSVGLA